MKFIATIAVASFAVFSASSHAQYVKGNEAVQATTTGTSPQQATNFNAPEPVTRAAVLYCFRVMVAGDIPMYAGCLRPIEIVIPDRLEYIWSWGQPGEPLPEQSRAVFSLQ